MSSPDHRPGGSDQGEFFFPEEPANPAAPSPWRAEWEGRLKELERQLGVPLNCQVEVTLAQGPVLRGKLYLEEEGLWPEGNRHRVLLRIGRATFRLGEIESVVRIESEDL